MVSLYNYNNKKGNILIFSYFIIAMLLVFGGTFLSRMMSEIRACDTFIKNAKAFQAAELALADACWRYDNHFPPPEGDIVVDDETVARIESINPAFGSFTLQAKGVVTGQGGAEVIKRLESAGFLSVLTYTLSGAGADAEDEQEDSQGEDEDGDQQGDASENDDQKQDVSPGSLIIEPENAEGETSGKITILGDVVLGGEIFNNDGKVDLVFEKSPLESYTKTVQPYLDMDCNGVQELGDFGGFIEMASEQLIDINPDSVLAIAVPTDAFTIGYGQDDADIEYTLDMNDIPAEKKTVFIYPESMSAADVDHLSVKLNGAFKHGMNQTFVVAGATDVFFDETEKSESDENSLFTLMSWRKAGLHGGGNGETERDFLSIVVMTHDDLSIVPNNGSTTHYKANLFAGGRCYIKTQKDTNLILEPGRAFRRGTTPALFKVDYPPGTYYYTAEMTRENSDDSELSNDGDDEDEDVSNEGAKTATP